MDTTNIFTLFSAVPSELRLMIWKYALPAHVIVDFIPILGTGDVLMPAGEPCLVRPIPSRDSSQIAQVCQEARRVIWGPYNKNGFAAGTALSPFYNANFFDFSTTTFYLNNGTFSHHCVSALAPEPIAIHVKRLAIEWSNYGDLIWTCKRLTVFPNLQQLIILVPPNLNLRTPPRVCAAITALDLYLQGKIYPIVDPLRAGSHLRDEVDKFVRFQCPHLSQKWPTIKAVLVPDLDLSLT
ncbi:hypothetical protein V490_07806 [Pseudogymnoascus sp. VKM F-3557]|nr:hypothetical protein V490_07806 [Pseudogymnoascus sp. VKM F-3557]